MAIHHISCRVTSSGVDSQAAITASMSWLSGGEIDLVFDKSTSYYGSVINIISFRLTTKKQMTNFVNRLPKEARLDLYNSIEQRIDDRKTIHFRLNLASLIGGQIIICSPAKRSVKCEIKIAVYPGQNVLEQAKMIIG